MSETYTVQYWYSTEAQMTVEAESVGDAVETAKDAIRYDVIGDSRPPIVEDCHDFEVFEKHD